MVLGIGTTIDVEVIKKILEGETERVEILEDMDKDPKEKKKAYYTPLLQSVL